MRDLIPWGRENTRAPSLYRNDGGNPFLALHREMNRLFDEAFRGFDMPASFGRPAAWTAWPNIEVTETEGEFCVAAEVPGMEENDIEVLLQDNVLVLRGEKKAETEDRQRQFSERFYGRFERRIPLGVDVVEDKVTANFRNGVLTVTLPKAEPAQSKARRIAIDGGS